MKISLKLIIAIIISVLFASNSILGQTGLSVHGYLTQAFAISSDYTVHGIPTNGTSDYRNLALQFRYDVDDKQNIVIQFSHERMGISPTMEFEEDLELDWAYFEYKFSDKFSAKIGKIQIPFGIYNEIRDVGTLIPFYRIPFAPYGEGNYMSETVDGIAFKYTNELFDNWTFENKIFYGFWKWYEWLKVPNPVTGGSLLTYGIANAENAVGFQSWIFTPFEELSFGGGFMRGHVAGGLTFSDLFIGEQDFNIANFSLNGSYDSFIIQSDYFNFWLDDEDMNVQMFNVQTGYKISEKLRFYLQTEYAGILDTRVTANQQQIYGAEIGDIDYYKNHGIALNYSVFTYLTLKLEHHWFEGYAIEDKYVQFFVDDPYKTQYSIFSVSTSF